MYSLERCFYEWLSKEYKSKLDEPIAKQRTTKSMKEYLAEVAKAEMVAEVDAGTYADINIGRIDKQVTTAVHNYLLDDGHDLILSQYTITDDSMFHVLCFHDGFSILSADGYIAFDLCDPNSFRNLSRTIKEFPPRTEKLLKLPKISF